jgi:hypothetical protein
MFAANNTSNYLKGVTVAMQAILLDEEQSSVVNQAREPVQVRDPAGNLLGRIVAGNAANDSFDDDHWVECWKEWYFETEEPEPENPAACQPKATRQCVAAK